MPFPASAGQSGPIRSRNGRRTARYASGSRLHRSWLAPAMVAISAEGKDVTAFRVHAPDGVLGHALGDRDPADLRPQLLLGELHQQPDMPR